MKKGVILKVISSVFALITILAIACAITGTGSGFLDLSNIARAVCIGVAVRVRSRSNNCSCIRKGCFADYGFSKREPSNHRRKNS